MNNHEEPASLYEFDRQMLDSVVGGVSALDLDRLNVQTPEEARQFVLAYGYDLNEPDQREQLWTLHRKSVALIREQLLDPTDVMPEEIHDPARLQDISRLLIFASLRSSGSASSSASGSVSGTISGSISGETDGAAPDQKDLQRWACAVLRVMHVYVHLRNDLFSAFRDEIQTQILKPLQDAIVHGDDGSISLKPSEDHSSIRLARFEIKPFKTTTSSVIKLLARPEKVALTLLDKLGVRIVTDSVFDSFCVIRFLIDNHILSYPHIIPDQSNNTLYPTNLFMEVMDSLSERASRGEKLGDEAVTLALNEKLNQSRERAQFFEKTNEFSGADYRFIKFISRKLISVSVGRSGAERTFKFFYPYEIQLMDKETYERNRSGPMAHDEYKSRQRYKARARVFGEKV